MAASYLDLVSFFSVHPEAMRYAADNDFGHAFSSMLRALFLIFANMLRYLLGSLDFICKLDPERYRSMLAKMRNKALSMDENAYPQSLSAAYRIAFGWTGRNKTRSKYKVLLTYRSHPIIKCVLSPRTRYHFYEIYHF